MENNGSEAKGKGQEGVMPVVYVEGVPQPAIFETNRPLKEHVQRLKTLEMREDDVVVLAYTKAGTHWMWEMASMLMAGKAEYEKRAKENAMLEATSIETIQAEPSPRVLNSHLPFRLLPRQILEKKVKVIHVYRNVKDVFVSMYYHYRQIGSENFTLESFEKIFQSEDIPTGNYFTYLKQMDEHMKNNPDLSVFSTSFEDIKEDPEKVVKNLADFLGVKASPQLCKDIAEATSFAKLKKADENKTQSTNIPPTNYYRKGEVGDWKNYLTVAQSERFDAAMTQLKSCDFCFRYTL